MSIRDRVQGRADGRSAGWLDRKRTTAATAIVTLVVGWGLTGEYLRSRDMQREYEKLQARADEMEDKNRRLTETAGGVSSREMLEREARLKMNLQKPGEQVIVINGTSASEPEELAIDVIGEDGNAVRWWRYFFQ
jgi:cell division protein FtsB